MTLIGPVIKDLRDLRLDLFRHLETRPSSFYDRVAVGRIMTRSLMMLKRFMNYCGGSAPWSASLCHFSSLSAVMLIIDVSG